MKRIKVLDKEFEISIPAERIQQVVSDLAAQINRDYAGKEIMLLSILNGSFMFAADLIRKITVPCQISFLKMASYQGTASTGHVKSLIGINENLDNKILVIVEDIIDTGITMENIFKQLAEHKPAEIRICTLLFKPAAFQKNFPIDYIGFKIPNDFIIGYGLDYDGLARNLEDIYVLAKYK